MKWQHFYLVKFRYFFLSFCSILLVSETFQPIREPASARAFHWLARVATETFLPSWTNSKPFRPRRHALCWRNLKSELSSWEGIECFQSAVGRRILMTSDLTLILDMRLKKKPRAEKSRLSRVIVFEKLQFQKVLCPHENTKPAFWNSSSLKRVFEMFRLSDGLLWTVGLSVEIQLRFQISLA